MQNRTRRHRTNGVLLRLGVSKCPMTLQSEGSGTRDVKNCRMQKMGFKNGIRPTYSSSAAESQRCHYCRGCGQRLSRGARSHFHKECLRSDKRDRLREQRRREEEKFRGWLMKQCCPKCGARYVESTSGEAIEESREASQPPQKCHSPVG